MAALAVSYVLFHRPSGHALQYYDLFMVGASWVVALIVTDGYASQIPSYRLESAAAVIKALPVTALLAVLIFFIHPYVLTRLILAGAVTIGTVLLIAMRTTLARTLLHESLATQVIVVSDSELSAESLAALRAARFEYRVVGSVIGPAKGRNAANLVRQVREMLARNQAQEVIVSN